MRRAFLTVATLGLVGLACSTGGLDTPTEAPKPTEVPSAKVITAEPTKTPLLAPTRIASPIPTRKLEAKPKPTSTQSPANNPTATRPPGDDPTESVPGAILRYLALGDSYTIGQSVDVADRWPNQLVRRLRQEDVTIADPVIVARTGWTTGELARAIAEADLEGTFDIVTLLIGVNNQFRGLNVEQFQMEFADLLDQAIAFAGGRPSAVIIVSIPDWGVTPFARSFDGSKIAQEIDLFNRVKLEETKKADAVYIDITGISRRADSQPDLIASDGLHPSAVMYSEWVNRILPAARAVISN